MTTDTRGKCIWKYCRHADYLETGCGNAFQLTCGTPSENGMRFCPYCGEHLEEEATDAPDAPDAPVRPRCEVCGTTDHHTDRHGNIVENPARTPVPHCWADELSQYDIGSEEWRDVALRGNATCLLPAGHEGPHEFIPDSKITVEFVWEEVEVEVKPVQVCEIEFVGQIGSEPLDIQGCLTHRYRFFSGRDEKPVACPVARGLVYPPPRRQMEVDDDLDD